MDNESSFDPGPGGKRVFFLHPNSVIQKDMLSELVKNEYEIYLIADHAKALPLFHKYPDSIVFINLDEGMKESEWEDYIRALQKDEALASLRIGIMTYNTDPAMAQKYLMDLMVPCGYIKLTLGLKESTDIVLKVLEANEARGRRKYLRVRCGDGQTSLNFQHNDKTISGKVIDISSVGMACVFSPDPNFPAHGLLDSIQIRLKGALCLVSGIVMGARLNPENERVYVLLFGPKTGADMRQKIRNYMQWKLQDTIEQELLHL